LKHVTNLYEYVTITYCLRLKFVRMVKPVRLISSYCCSWRVLPRYVLLIGDKGMVCETSIHGYLLMHYLKR